VGVLMIIYLFLRLNKFEERTTYHLDQGLHLLESWEMVTNKDIRLIGPMVSSKTFMDRGFFIGPQYYYVLAFLGIITKWNPIAIDVILLVIELGFILYWVNWIRKKYGVTEALMVFGILTFSRYFIIHSRFFWNPHFLLPLGIMAVIILDKYIKNNKIKYLLGFGFLWGLAFGFHYSAVFLGIPLLTILIKNKKLWNKNTFIYLPIGFILGDLPWFIFEIKHNFYNIRTVLWVMSQSTGGGKMEPHYFIYPLVVFGLLGLVVLINKIKKNKILASLILVIGISWLQVKLINDPIPLGHPIGWNYLIQKEVVNKILVNGCPKNFNIASTVSGDTRSYDLRFLLTRKGCEPMGVEEYPKAEKLFLVAPVDRPPEIETVWEVSSLGKFKVKREENLSKKIKFYELEKI
jgi:hypothetical protein